MPFFFQGATTYLDLPIRGWVFLIETTFKKNSLFSGIEYDLEI